MCPWDNNFFFFYYLFKWLHILTKLVLIVYFFPFCYNVFNWYVWICYFKSLRYSGLAQTHNWTNAILDKEFIFHLLCGAFAVMLRKTVGSPAFLHGCVWIQVLAPPQLPLSHYCANSHTYMNSEILAFVTHPQSLWRLKLCLRFSVIWLFFLSHTYKF